MTISQSRPMIELRDLPTEGGRESVPVSRTRLNHPVSYARQNRSSVSCPCAGLPELRDLPTEGGRESVPVSRTLLNHPASYARQNPEFRFLALRWTATLRGSSCQYRIAV